MTTLDSISARFAQKLTEQLCFMKRSCELFDLGAEDESLRLAAALRIIFHDAKHSTSIMSHLGFENNRIWSSTRGHGDWKDYLAQQLDINSAQPIRMLPLLGNQFVDLSIKEWWNREPVFVHNCQACTRKRLILSAANKDGGAHVDKQLEKYYEVLCAGEYAMGITGNLEYDGVPPFPQGVTVYAKNAHLALIRQFAHEVLLSVNHFAWLVER